MNTLHFAIIAITAIVFFGTGFAFAYANNYDPVLEEAKNKLFSFESTNKNSTFLPISSYGVDYQHMTLLVVINDTAPLAKSVYEQRIQSIVGYVPLTVEFGHFTFDLGIFTGVGNRTIETTVKIIPANDTSRPLDKYIQLRFFDAINNQTLDHVAFFLNISKNNQTILHDLFETDSGFSSILIEPNETMSIGNWIVYGDHEPILNGWVPKNDTLKISTPLFQNGLYNFQIVMFAMTSYKELFNASTEPKFDSFWNVDQNGNFTSYINSDILALKQTAFVNKLKEEGTSPLSDEILLNGMGMRGNHIPYWFKNVKEWLYNGQISNDEFVNAIKYLDENGIIK